MINVSDFYLKAVKRLENIDKRKLADWVVALCEDQVQLIDLLNTIQEGVLVVTKSLQVTLINSSAQHLLGSSHHPEKDVTLAHVVADQNLRQLIEASVKSNKERFNEPFRILTPHNRSFQLSVLKLRKSKYDFLIILFPETHLDERVKEKYKEEHLSAIVTLAAGVAHEIGNPLNSINIHLQLINKQLNKIKSQNSKSIKSSLNVVSEETKRLDQIIKNFLRATRRKPIQYQKGDLYQILQEVFSLVSPQLKQQKIKLRTKFDDQLEPFLMDEERLNQVFLNIIKNSIQAMPKGGVLQVSTKKNQMVCRISIQDTGHGMDRKALSRIFDAYYTTKEEGSGLGLVIAYQIIREHHGRIEVQSHLGSGTTFHIYLPIQKEKLPLPSPKMVQKHNEQFI